MTDRPAVQADAPTPGWPRVLVLVRHAESIGNLAAEAASAKGVSRLELEYRDPDTPLSDTGTEQARALGRHLAGRDATARPDVVVGSPYVRAASTMAAALADWPDAPAAVLDERLRERDLGLFDGLTGAGIRELHPEEATRREAMGKFYYRPPGGESWVDVVLRVRSLLRDLRAEHADRRVWVFTHQAVIMAFRYVLESLTEEDVLEADRGTPLANCSLTVYRRGADGLDLQVYGAVDHLEESPAETTHEEPTAATAGQPPGSDR